MLKKKYILGSALLLTLLAVGLFIAKVQAAPTTDTTCTLTSGCILRESGSNAQWWADSWDSVYCRDHDPKKGQDWIVNYKVNNDDWRAADPTKVRFYAAYWSGYWFWKWSNKVQVENTYSLPSGGGITVCLSGVLSSNSVKGTYLWRQP